MNKMEALKYLIKHRMDYGEWGEAGMYHALKEVIESEKEEFTKEELNKLLYDAENF